MKEWKLKTTKKHATQGKGTLRFVERFDAEVS